MRLHAGDQVTVTPAEDVPLQLHLQRYAKIARAVDGGYMVTVDDIVKPPPGCGCDCERCRPGLQEFGPIPPARLRVGWKDNQGRWL